MHQEETGTQKFQALLTNSVKNQMGLEKLCSWPHPLPEDLSHLGVPYHRFELLEANFASHSPQIYLPVLQHIAGVLYIDPEPEEAFQCIQTRGQGVDLEVPKGQEEICST